MFIPNNTQVVVDFYLISQLISYYIRDIIVFVSIGSIIFKLMSKKPNAKEKEVKINDIYIYIFMVSGENISIKLSLPWFPASDFRFSRSLFTLVELQSIPPFFLSVDYSVELTQVYTRQ